MGEERLAISLVQYDIVWEDKQQNLSYLRDIVLGLSGKTDLIVLPEMSFTGFSLDTSVAEMPEGNLFAEVEKLAKESQAAVCGSMLVKEEEKFFNRAFFITPQESYFYDKRHLFRVGAEGKVMTAGEEKVIFNYKGFNICLLVCYDLRFPVWSRNVANEYDLAIYVANWPEPRKKVWDILLKARAIENQCYVCGVNRVGRDKNNLNYLGNSMFINEKGDPIVILPEGTAVETIVIDKVSLMEMRTKFPVWKDADTFEIRYD